MNFLPIRLNTILSEQDLTFDLYIKLPSKYIKYIHEGDSLEEIRKKKLKDKKIKKLFIPEEQEERFQKFIDHMLDEAANNENMAAADKAIAVNGVTQKAVDEIYENVDSLAAFKVCEKAAKSIVDIVGENPDVLKEMLQMASEESGQDPQDTAVRFASQLASIVVRLGKKLGLDKESLNNLGVSGLLCDIGFTKLSPDIIPHMKNEIKDMPEDLLKEYKTHPKVSVEMLQDKKHINGNVLRLVLAHEEDKAGTGFPEKKKTLEKDEEILALCCNYTRRTIYQGMGYKEAIKALELDEIGKYDLTYIQALKKIVKEELS